MTLQRLAACMLVIIHLFVLPGCQDENEKKVKHYQRALEYIKLDDPKSAIIELRNAIGIDAKYSEARYQLGLLYLDTGDPRAAFGELQRTVSLDPTNLDAGTKVAEFFLLARDHDQSRKYMEQVLAQDPEYVDALALKANLELIEGNFELAGEAIDKALAKQPENDKYLNIKGRVMSAQNNRDEAERLFRRAIASDPDSFAHYRTLLMLYEQEENEAAKQELLATMIDRFPDNPQLYLMLAEMHAKKGESAEAEDALKKAIEHQQDAPSLRYMLSEHYKNHNQFDRAQETLVQAIEDFPEDNQVKTALADLYFDLRNFEAARQLMDQILAKNPAHGGANLLKARFLIRDHRINEAIDILTPLTTDFPKWADPFYYAALAHMRINKPELALKAIESAVQNNPANDRFHALAAQIHLLDGDNAAAGKEASIALRLNPRNFIAVKILAKSYVQAKDFDKAIKLINILEDNDVKADVEMLTTLGMAYLGAGEKDNARETFTRLLEMNPRNSQALSLLTTLKYGKDINGALNFVKNHVTSHPTADGYILLGDLYAKNQLYEDALTVWDEARELDPENIMSYVQSARLLDGLEKPQEAEQQYLALRQQSPNSIPALMGLAAIYEKTGRLAEAKTTYKRVLELQPENPIAANNLAWLIASEENGDLGEALRLAMQAKQAMPTQPHIADTLGWVHYQRKSYPLAISQFKQALESRQGDPAILYHLALAQYGNGEQDAAVQILEEALAQNPAFPQREEAMATLDRWKSGRQD